MSDQTESLDALYGELSERFPDEWVQEFRQGGEDLSFVPWHRYVQRLHEIAPMQWSTSIDTVQEIGGYLVMTVTLHLAGRFFTQVGIAQAEKSKTKGYGGAAPEAYSQAFRRACAMAGLGLGFYQGVYDELPAGAEVVEVEEYDGPEPTEVQVERMKELIGILEENEYNEAAQQARERIRNAKDRRKVTGVVIRKLKEFLSERGLWEEQEDEGDTPFE